MRSTLTTRPTRAALVLAAGALLATGATACEPPPPPTGFTIEVAATGPDATPGDGTCANADGRCSLEAAVDEANALDTGTVVTVPPGEVAAADLTVTGAVTLVAGDDVQDLIDVTWTVADGAQLNLSDAELGPITVDGTLLGRRVGLGSGRSGPITGVPSLLEVNATGTAVLSNAVAFSWGAPLATNAGVLAFNGTTFTPAAAPGPATLTTEPGGQTRLAASVFLGGAAAVDACAGGPATSYGYNLAPDTTCGLTATGDRQDFTETSFYPQPGSLRVDTVPVGTLSCGEGWTDEARTANPVRPYDGDQDTVAACDSGAFELRPGP